MPPPDVGSSIPSTLGEHSVPGGIVPEEAFEKHYEKVDL